MAVPGGARRSAARLLLFLLPLLLLPGRGGAVEPPGSLRDRALSLRLHEEREWKVLLHYRPSLGGETSLVDDPAFFLAPEGKTDPAAELSADVLALFAPGAPSPGRPPAQGFPGDVSLPARCRFPARYEWLAGRLGVDTGGPSWTSACAWLDNALSVLRPRSATLVFASAYLNAPASMAGHTFLRVDGPGQSALLSFAVNYAARPDPDDPGPVYATKGLFGLYPGYYSILPYYEKLKEYGNLERRDLWEYPLSLTEEETRRMTLHALELQGIWSNYFFLDENCSYILLFLLEAGRPSLRLTEPKGTFFLPVETIARVQGEGLSGPPRFRPSPVRALRQVLSGVPEGDRPLASALARGELSPEAPQLSALPEGRRALLLDVAASRLNLSFMSRETPLPEYRARYHALLAERSRLDAPPPADPPAPPPPEAAHRSRRLSLSLGNDGRGFAEAGYRPAIHDLSDPGEGYPEGSRIVFLDGRVRVRDDGGARLHRLDLVDLFSAAPRDVLFAPRSWKMAAGMETGRFDGGRERQRWRGVAGGGVAWTLWPEGAVYAMAEGEGVLCRGLDRGWGVLAGLSAGVAGSLSPRVPLDAGARHLWGLAGDGSAIRETRGELRLGYRTTPSTALSVEGIWAGNDEYRWAEGRLQAGWYF